MASGSPVAAETPVVGGCVWWRGLDPVKGSGRHDTSEVAVGLHPLRGRLRPEVLVVASFHFGTPGGKHVASAPYALAGPVTSARR